MFTGDVADLFMTSGEWKTLADFETQAKEWEYQGFSVPTAMKALNKLVAAAIKKTNKDDVRSAIQLLIGIGASFGPKAVYDTSITWKKGVFKKNNLESKIRAAVSLLGLSSPKTAQPADEITLSRLMILLPEVTAMVYVKLDAMGQAKDFLDRGQPFEDAAAKVPKWMLYPGMVIFAETESEYKAIRAYQVSVQGKLSVGGPARDAGKIVDTAYAKRGDYGEAKRISGIRAEIQKMAQKYHLG